MLVAADANRIFTAKRDDLSAHVDRKTFINGLDRTTLLALHNDINDAIAGRWTNKKSFNPAELPYQFEVDSAKPSNPFSSKKINRWYRSLVNGVSTQVLNLLKFTVDNNLHKAAKAIVNNTGLFNLKSSLKPSIETLVNAAVKFNDTDFINTMLSFLTMYTNNNDFDQKKSLLLVRSAMNYLITLAALNDRVKILKKVSEIEFFINVKKGNGENPSETKLVNLFSFTDLDIDHCLALATENHRFKVIRYMNKLKTERKPEEN